MSTGEILYVGRKDDKYFAKGYLFPEPINPLYFNSVCRNWQDNVAESGWNACYWKVDDVISTLIHESSDGTRINGATGQVSADHKVFQTWQTERGIELTATDVRTGHTEFLPNAPVFPQSILPTGKFFPRILSWTEGYEPSANGNWLQAGVIGHVFLWDLDTMLYRQVTCEEGYGRFSGVFFLPGDTSGRYGIIASKIGDTHLIFIKDLHAAGIMSEGGHLLPPPEK